MSIFKDFVGINICIYDPILTDTGAIGGNTFGYGGTVTFPYNYDTPSGMTQQPRVPTGTQQVQVLQMLAH